MLWLKMKSYELILNKVIRDLESEDIYPAIPYFKGPVDIETIQNIDDKRGGNMTEFHI